MEGAMIYPGLLESDVARWRVAEAIEEGYALAESGPRTTASGPEPGPIPDPFDDADALEELEEEITTLAAHIAAAEHRFLTLLAEFDRRRGWELGGHRSAADWLHYRTGLDKRTARDRVRTARALVELPQTSEAMSRGELAFSQVRALTRVATPECEAELLEVAKGMPTAELERLVRGWRKWSRADEEALERDRWRRRRFAVWADDEGMYEVRGKVPAEVGALLMRAVEAASDALFREEAKEETTPDQRRADALGLLAERALWAGFGEREANGSAEPGGRSGSGGVERAEASEENGSCEPPVPISGTKPERYQVFLHVDADTLSQNGEPGRSHLEDGTRLAAETSRRLTCDASVVRVLRGPEGEVLDLGRKRRTASPALRRALEIRDRGCRWPGCGLRFAEAHHITHWADGGETNQENTLLLCASHHRKVHEGGWKVFLNRKDGTAVFADPRGRVRRASRRPEVSGSLKALVDENARRGIVPDGWALTPRYKTRRDIPWELDARALEALDEAHFGG